MKSSAYTFKFLRRTALSFALLVSVTSFGSADQCLNYGDRLNQSHSLYQESIDPYAHLLPDELEQANPLATILSFSMALRYSLDESDWADAIEKAVQHVLESGIRTADIMADQTRQVSTSGMGDALIEALDTMKAKAA